MKRFKVFAVFLCIIITLSLTGCSPEKIGISEEGRINVNPSINLSALPQIDTWPDFMVHSENNDDQLKIEVEYFQSGSEMFAELQNDKWNVACMGVYPTMLMLKKGDCEVIGISSNEAAANAIIGRKGDDIFDTKDGDLLGDKEVLSGKTFIVTPSSTGSLLLHHYLNHFDMSEKDIVIESMEPEEAVHAFKNGTGDYLVTWSPYIYEFPDNNYQEIVTGNQLSLMIPMVYLAKSDWLKDNVENVREYFKRRDKYIKMFNNKPQEIEDSVKKYFSTNELSLKEKALKEEFSRHTLYLSDQQSEMLTTGNLKKSLESSAEIFHSQEKFTEKDLQQFKDNNYYINTDVFE